MPWKLQIKGTGSRDPGVGSANWRGFWMPQSARNELSTIAVHLDIPLEEPKLRNICHRRKSRPVHRSILLESQRMEKRYSLKQVWTGSASGPPIHPYPWWEHLHPRWPPEPNPKVRNVEIWPIPEQNHRPPISLKPAQKPFPSNNDSWPQIHIRHRWLQRQRPDTLINWKVWYFHSEMGSRESNEYKESMLCCLSNN